MHVSDLVTKWLRGNAIAQSYKSKTFLPWTSEAAERDMEGRISPVSCLLEWQFHVL